MAFNNSMKTCDRSDWETPPMFFAAIDAQFGFTLDAAANAENTKCERYFTKEDDALVQRWDGVVWCNPPYGQDVEPFIRKGYEESQLGSVVVMLVAARTDTKWWHNWAMKAEEIYLIKGRLKFVGAKDGAPFPSALLIFRPGKHKPRFTTGAPKPKVRGH